MFSGLNDSYHEINEYNCVYFVLAFIAHFVSKATTIHFIDGNDNHSYMCWINLHTHARGVRTHTHTHARTHTHILMQKPEEFQETGCKPDLKRNFAQVVFKLLNNTNKTE